MGKHYHSGYDYFTPDPGTEKSMKCRACGFEMDVARGVEVGSRWGHLSPDPQKRKVDKFTCTHAGEKWHNQAIELKKLIGRTPSQVISSLVEAELHQIISTRKPTKDSWLP